MEEGAWVDSLSPFGDVVTFAWVDSLSSFGDAVTFVGGGGEGDAFGEDGEEVGENG
jgi:hypothetical protein